MRILYSSMKSKKGSTLLLATIFCAFSSLVMAGLLGHITQESRLLEKQIGKTQSQYLSEGILEFRQNIHVVAETAVNPSTGKKYMGDLFSTESQTRIDTIVRNASRTSNDFMFNFDVGFTSIREQHDYQGWTRDAEEEKITKYKYLVTRQAEVTLSDRVPTYRRDVTGITGYKEWVSTIPLTSLVAMGDNLEIINDVHDFRITGRVHSNGDIMISGNGNENPLIFNHEITNGADQGEAAISAVGNIYRRSAGSGYSSEFKYSSYDDEEQSIKVSGYPMASYLALSNSSGVVNPTAPDSDKYFEISNTNASDENADADKRRFPATNEYVFIDYVNFDNIIDGNDIDNKIVGIPGVTTAHQYINDIQYEYIYDSNLQDNSNPHRFRNGDLSGRSRARDAYVTIRDGVIYKDYADIIPCVPITNSDNITQGWYPSKYHPNRMKYNDLRWYGWYGRNFGVNAPSAGNPAIWHFPVRSVTFIDSDEDPTNAIYADRASLDADPNNPPAPTPNICFTSRYNRLRNPERQAFSNLATPEYSANANNDSAATLVAANAGTHFINTRKRLHHVYSGITNSNLDELQSYLYTGPNPAYGAAKQWDDLEAFHQNGGVFNPKKTDLLRAQYVQLKKEVRRLHNAHHIYTSQIGLVQWYERVAYAGVRCPFENSDLDPADNNMGCVNGRWWKGNYVDCPTCNSNGNISDAHACTVLVPNPPGAPIHPAGCVTCGGDQWVDAVPCNNPLCEPAQGWKIKSWDFNCPDCDNSGYKNGFPPHSASWGWQYWDGGYPVAFWNKWDPAVTAQEYTYPRIGEPGAAPNGGMYVTLNHNGTVPDCYLPNDPAYFPRAAIQSGLTINSSNHWPNIWGQKDNNNTYAPTPANYTNNALLQTNNPVDTATYFMDTSIPALTRKAFMSFSAFWDDDNNSNTPKVELFPFNAPTVKSNDNGATLNPNDNRLMYTYGIYKSTLPLSDRTIPMPKDGSNDAPGSDSDNQYGLGYLQNFWYDTDPANGGTKTPISYKLNKPACYWRLNNYPETLKRFTFYNPASAPNTSNVRRQGGAPYHVDKFWYNGNETGGYFGNDNLCMFNEREKKFVVFTEINMREFTAEAFYLNGTNYYAPANYGIYAVNSTIGKNVLGKTVHCGAIRLKRGGLYYNNFSFASPNPVYIWGDFNWPNFNHTEDVNQIDFTYNVPSDISIDDSWAWTTRKSMIIYADSLNVLPNNAFPGSAAANVLQDTLRDGNGNSPFTANNVPNDGEIQKDKRLYFDSQLWWEDDGVRVLGGAGKSGDEDSFDAHVRGSLEDFINYTAVIFKSTRYKPVIENADEDNRDYQTPILSFASQGITCNFVYGKVKSLPPVLFEQADIDNMKDPINGDAAPSIPQDSNSDNLLTDLEWYLNWIPKGEYQTVPNTYDDLQLLFDNEHIHDFNGYEIRFSDYYGMNFSDFTHMTGDEDFENFKLYFSGGGIANDLRQHKPFLNEGSMKLHVVGSCVSLFEAYQDNSFFNPFQLGASKPPQLVIENYRNYCYPLLWAIEAQMQEEGEFFAVKGSKYRRDGNTFTPDEADGWRVDA
ncbi:MAG: hypothetical protein ACD_79C01265G0002 [uncultured bacterium]|nr:MAG: hypothetical protein ACD_79C01265G0002 [uncultured bacterium]